MLRDELIRTLAADSTLSVRVLSASNLVREAAHRHRTSPAATVALGRALMGGLLLASESSPDLRVQLHFRARGPLGPVLVTADGGGRVRGYVTNPTIETPPVGPHLGVATALGLGELAVERMRAGWKRPYSGIVPMANGEIAEDLALYLLESEQKPSALALGLYLGPGGEVEAAGGYLVQALPGTDASHLVRLEERVRANSNPSEQFRSGTSCHQMLEQLLCDTGHGAIDHSQPRFHCGCDSSRVLRAAALLGKKEIREIVEANEDLEVRCSWCAEVYRLTADQLGATLHDA